jgi:tetratricopeptide (TPR) repeat protein
VEKTKIIAAMAAAAMLFAAQIYFSLNYNILFFYWIFISIVAIFLRERLVKINRKREENKITKSVIKKILYIMFGLILAPFFLWVLSEQINFALADYYYKKNPDNEAYLIKSASLAFRRHNYKLLLSGFYLHKANGLMNDPNITDEKKEDLKILISQAITAGESAARLAPNDIDVYAHLGRLYRNISDIVIGSQEVSINNFKKALELEPDNPIYLNELGKLYFNKKLFPEARDYFISALKIMPELDEARLELAKTFTEDNQPEEALKILNDLEIKNADIEILFEQGKIYFNQKKYEEARDKFLFILAKYPNHANALYSLGLTLEALGRPYEALPYYKKTLELNPHNQTIIDKMKNIEATISG